MDETYFRTGGKWRYLWRAIEHYDKIIDFRFTKGRDAKAACVFFRQVRETVRIYGPVSVSTDKAPTYVRVIGGMNAYSFPGIESNHAALKRVTGPGRGL